MSRTSSRPKRVTTANKARMNFRLDPEIKDRVARAAAISGQGMTDFAISTLSARADEIIERHSVITLSSEDYSSFLRILDAEEKPSKRSLDAAQRYRRGKRKGVRHHW